MNQEYEAERTENNDSNLDDNYFSYLTPSGFTFFIISKRTQTLHIMTPAHTTSNPQHVDFLTLLSCTQTAITFSYKAVTV